MNKCFYRQAVFLSLIPLISVGACTKRIYIPTERVEILRDSSLRVTATVDTLMLRDSISERFIGDSIIKEAWHTRYVTRLRRDTAIRYQHDTITLVKTIPPDSADSSPSTRSASARQWLRRILIVALIVIAAGFYLRKRT